MADVDLSGRVALVTGSTRGLGRVIAADLHERGARVVVHGRSQGEAEDVARALGGSAVGIAADLSEGPEAASRLLSRIEESVGVTELLVNNAADQALTPLATSALDAWRSIVDVTLVAAAELTRLVCASAGAREGMSVVNVASVEAFAPFPGHGAYAAAKAGLVSFTAAAALEYRPIRVNAVAPGLVDRPGLAEEWPEGFAWWSASAPLGRPVHAGEVAAAVAFLLSPLASGITGVTLPVDGGWTSSARAPWGPREA